jgi:hypothetical protein
LLECGQCCLGIILGHKNQTNFKEDMLSIAAVNSIDTTLGRTNLSAQTTTSPHIFYKRKK